jgi:hypothetical protein
MMTLTPSVWTKAGARRSDLTFANAGTFEFACPIPATTNLVLHGPITVSKMAQADVVYTKVSITDAKGGKVTINHGLAQPRYASHEMVSWTKR